MSARLVIASLAVGALVLAAAALLDWPLERAVLLAPVIVVVVAATAGLFVLWVRVGLDSLRASRRPRLVVALSLAAVAVFVVLALLGVKLPRE